MQKTIASIDPGIRGCGLAIFSQDDGVLIRSEYVINPKAHGQKLNQQLDIAIEVANSIGLDDCRTLIVEWPQVYASDIHKSNANDLLPLCGLLGAIVAIVRPWAVVQYKPAQWKGQLDKKTGNARILKRLTAVERCLVPKNHNVIDAVGIGLKFLGRFEPKRIIARGNEHEKNEQEQG